jgi:large subunit ribosomal protein L6
MSRVGKQPIPLADGVSVEVKGDEIHVKGPKGKLSAKIPSDIKVEIEAGQVRFERPDERRPTRALHGLARALVANMVHGVVTPFVKKLEIQGVGYRADVSDKTLNLLLGFSHPVSMPIPEGLEVVVDRNVMISVTGIDRQQVGQFAADVRSLRPPEPYKGKGIRYENEQVRRKVGKAGVSAGA